MRLDMAGNCVYHRGSFIIVKEGRDSFIVVNTSKKFGEINHTHLKSFKRGKDLIDFAITKTIPRHPDQFILTSLIRISSDKRYIKNLELKKREIIEEHYKNGGV